MFFLYVFGSVCKMYGHLTQQWDVDIAICVGIM